MEESLLASKPSSAEWTLSDDRRMSRFFSKSAASVLFPSGQKYGDSPIMIIGRSESASLCNDAKASNDTLALGPTARAFQAGDLDASTPLSTIA